MRGSAKRKTEDRSQMPEGGGRRSVDSREHPTSNIQHRTSRQRKARSAERRAGNRRTEDGGRKAEGRGQRTERKVENRKQKTKKNFSFQLSVFQLLRMSRCWRRGRAGTFLTVNWRPD